MVFSLLSLDYDSSVPNPLLEYVVVEPMKDGSISSSGFGNYSVTGFKFRLKRRPFQYIVNYYLPSSLFVVVSWVS